MRTKMFGLVVVLFLCASYAGAQECEAWRGAWEVKKTDGSTLTWNIDTATTETGSPFLSCKASGKEKAAGKADSAIQIIWVTFANGYVYYQGTESPGMGTPSSQLGTLNAAKDAFTSADPKELGIVSGKKIVEKTAAPPATK